MKKRENNNSLELPHQQVCVSLGAGGCFYDELPIYLM